MLARKTPCLSAKLTSLLLLDVGGVLLENVLRDEWWKRLAHRSERSAAELAQIFTSDLKPGLWTGRISSSDFWQRLAVLVDPDMPGLPLQLQRELADDLRPLPAIARVTEWARQVHVALLSNNVTEWVRPHFIRFGLYDSCDFIMVSDQTGLRKPERSAFQGALDAWRKPPNTVLCVDDNETNLAVASEIGMATLLAAPSDRWDRHVDRWIERQR